MEIPTCVNGFFFFVFADFFFSFRCFTLERTDDSFDAKRGVQLPFVAMVKKSHFVQKSFDISTRVLVLE